VLKALLNKAVQWGLLLKNPCKGVKMLPNMKNARIRYFIPEELQKIFSDKTVDDNFKTLLFTLLYTGIRLDEALHLSWGDIDFQREILKIQEKEDWTPKDYERREIPIHPFLKDALLKLRETSTQEYLFTSPQSGKYYRHNVIKRFKRLLKRVNIKNASIHTFRHTFASYLVMSGVDIVTVKELLGHSSITTTMKYAHLAPDYLKNAIYRLKFEINIYPQGFKPPTGFYYTEFKFH